jgi:hypothetical protein
MAALAFFLLVSELLSAAIKARGFALDLEQILSSNSCISLAAWYYVVYLSSHHWDDVSCQGCRHTLTGSGLDLEPETEVTKLRMARRT